MDKRPSQTGLKPTLKSLISGEGGELEEGGGVLKYFERNFVGGYKMVLKF